MTDVVLSPKGLVGELFGDGRYDLRELLGGGSMGYVYRALDRRLETPVVIKIPRQNRIERADFMKRFRQESKFLVKLTHPHIVGILDVGEHKGLPYFVMPFVGGGSLRSRQRNEFGMAKGLPPESLGAWLREIARALDFIHSQGCVHRDVKPDNILFDEHGHAFLTDFGLSKVMGSGGGEDLAQTAAGAVVGTPLYVSPEQVLGTDIDGRSDQYSLALTVFETLSAVNPFEGPTSSATMVNQANKAPPPLDEMTPRISRALAAVIERGLAKEPSERFPKCVDFADAVLAAVAASDARPNASMVAAAPVRSSGTNRLDETSPALRRTMASQIVPSPARPPAPVKPPAPAPTPSRRMQYVATKRSAIVKAKTECPQCKRTFVLQPSFACRKAACNTCGSKLLITPDFSEVQQLELVEIREDAPPTATAISDPSNELDLVLGQELFGWKLNRKVALGLAMGLVVLLIGMTAFFVNRSNKTERERERQILTPRHTE